MDAEVCLFLVHSPPSPPTDTVEHKETHHERHVVYKL